MVTFNIHWGQMRLKPTGTSLSLGGTHGVQFPQVAGVDGTGMYYKKTSSKRLLMMASLTGKRGAVRYDADKFGNIEVTGPKHLHAMRELGYPIYIGPNRSVGPWENSTVVWEDLLWPRPDLADDPYFRHILEAVSARQE